MIKEFFKRFLPIVIVIMMVAVAFYQVHKQGEINGKLGSIQEIYQQGFEAGQSQVYNLVFKQLKEQGFLRITYKSTKEGEEDQVIFLVPFQNNPKEEKADNNE